MSWNYKFLTYGAKTFYNDPWEPEVENQDMENTPRDATTKQRQNRVGKALDKPAELHNRKRDNNNIWFKEENVSKVF